MNLMEAINGVNKTNGHSAIAEVSSMSSSRIADVLTDTPQASGYKPGMAMHMNWAWAGQVIPYRLILMDVESMRRHPQASVCMLYYRSAIWGAEFEITHADSSKTEELAQKEIRKFWNRGLRSVQEMYDYGWSSHEVCYEEVNGYLSFHSLFNFAPYDVIPLTRKHRYIGIRLRSSSGVSLGNQLDLWASNWPDIPAKGLWCKHNDRWSSWYGVTQYLSAWLPWRRLAYPDTCEEIIDMGAYRFAYTGPVLHYPEGAVIDQRTGKRIDNRDKALELGEAIKCGGVVVLSSARDEHGQLLWELKWPEHTLDLTGLIGYDKYLRDLIAYGIGVPPEILQATDTGSGYSGRSIPKESFYVSQQFNAEYIAQLWREQIGLPLAKWNLGPDAHFEITVKPLLKTAVEQSTALSAMVNQGGAPNGTPSPLSGTPPPPNPLAGTEKPENKSPVSEILSEVGKPDMADKPQGAQNLALDPNLSADVPPELAEIYQRVKEAARIIAAKCRRELQHALRNYPQGQWSEHILRIFKKHEPALARLFRDMELATKIAGMQDIANGLPQYEPLPTALVTMNELLGKLSATEREAVISMFPLEIQVRLREKPPIETNLPPESPWEIPSGHGDSEPVAHFPMIEEGAAVLQGKTPVRRDMFDTLNMEARQNAFTIAGNLTQDSIAKAQKILADNALKGASKEEFARQIEEELGEGTFLSDGHMENVFRTNIMQVFSDGKDKILEDPLVGNAFPYAQVTAVHDTRVEPNHLAMEKYGINGTAVYRRDDPVFQKFKGPWRWNCRCGWIALTIAAAAALGIPEAIEWMRGKPPVQPTWVPHPPFDLPEGWTRR